MRYIFSILLLAVVFSIITGFYILQKKEPAPNLGLMVNDRVISAAEFNELRRNSYQDQEDSQQFIESLIIRELLIQEAKKMGIDQDEDFRHLIQNFYEQSLTKILLEHKSDSFAYNPSKQEIDRLLELQNYQIELTLFPVSEPSSLENKHQGLFRNLATTMQVAALPLTVGEKSEPILINDIEHIIRLDNLIKIPLNYKTEITPEEAHQIIANDHQEQSLVEWLHELRKHAIVKISPENSTENLVKERSTP